MESTTKNFFENPMGNAGGVGLGAGVGGLIGAWLGNNGALGGNREPAVTPDQLQATINGLQGQMSTDAIQGHLGRIQGQIAGTAADSTIALGAGIAGVKDAVVSSAAQNALALCGLGHTVQAGFASTNQTILLEGARTRELTQQTEINRLLALNAQQHSDAGHARTQVLIQALASANSGN